MQQKVIVSGENRIKLCMGQRRSFFIDVTADFFLSLQLDAAVAAIINTDAVFLAQQHTGIFFLVSSIPIIIKIQAADEIAAIRCVRVQMKHRSQPHCQLCLIRIGNKIFQLVAVFFSGAGGRRGQQAPAPLKQAWPVVLPRSTLHRYPPRCCRPAGRKNRSCHNACRPR